MNTLPIDRSASQNNPWSLDEEECAVLRALYSLGTSAGLRHLGTNHKTVKEVLRRARRKMGLGVHDIKVYVNWHEWTRHQDSGYDKRVLRRTPVLLLPPTR